MSERRFADDAAGSGTQPNDDNDVINEFLSSCTFDQQLHPRLYSTFQKRGIGETVNRFNQLKRNSLQADTISPNTKQELRRLWIQLFRNLEETKKLGNWGKTYELEEEMDHVGLCTFGFQELQQMKREARTNLQTQQVVVAPTSGKKYYRV
jgi:hypothetical protein